MRIVLFPVFWLASLSSFSWAAGPTAILSVRRGAVVAGPELNALLTAPEVRSRRPVFRGREAELLKKSGAAHLTKSWVVEVASAAEFEKLESRIRRRGLPVALDWNEMEFKLQGDAFENLQWALKNDGTPQNVDLDPMQAYRVAARAGEDVRPPAPVRGKKILVAVLDTGVDHGHPDLRAVVHRDESECAALAKFETCVADKDRATCEKIWMDPKNPETDRDGNGYPLDCHGWSLLGGVNAAGIMGRPDFTDDQGHGTHVAGLIAAARDGRGVVGVSNNVEILPVQVLGEQPSEPLKPLSVDFVPSEEGRAGLNQSLGDMVARGVIYAMLSGAKVINFSMGWPQSRDSEFMRAVIAEAQSRGILVVAAAGNDSTRALLRPCAYPGVICVGASGPDGAPAHFSNHGSGVDLTAPGTNILSTYPMSKRPVRFRQTLGYEFLSGTSQASPLVAGAAAELLARGIPAAEVYPRLILSSRPVPKALPLLNGLPHELGRELPEDPQVYRKLAIGGNLDIAGALTQLPRPLIVPAAKEKAEILWDRRARELSFDFTLKNHWQPISTDAVRVLGAFAKPARDAVRPALVSIAPVKAPGAVWNAGEERVYRATFRIDDAANVSDSRIPSELDLMIDVAQKGQPRSRRFVLTAEIVVPVTPNLAGDDVLTLPIQGMPKGRHSFLPIDENLDGQPRRRDYLAVQENASTRQIWLVTQASSRADAAYEVKGGTKIRVTGDPEDLREQVLARMDVDGDGRSEYVLGLYEDRSGKDENRESPMTFYVFDGELRLKRQFAYDSKIAQIPFTVSWMTFGGVKCPAWVGAGKDPAKKIGLRDRWENPTNAEKNEVRFYWVDGAGKARAVQEYKGYRIIDVIEPRASQKRAGRVPVLMAKNAGTEAKPSYVYRFAVAEMFEGRVENFREMDFFGEGRSDRNLLDTRVDKVQSLDPDDDEYKGSFWFGEGVTRRQRLTILDTESFENRDADLGALRRSYDSALWVRAAFLGENRAGAFVLTNSEIQYHDLSTRATVSTSFERYTFYPDMLMTNLYFPVTLRDSRSSAAKLPALFTTESSQLSRGVKMLVPSFARDGRLIELVSPARLRLKAGEGCRPMDTPVFLGEEAYALDYYCGDRLVRVRLKY